MNEKTDQDVDRLVSALNDQSENTPALATLVYETPMGSGAIAPVHPLDEEIVQEAPMGQTIIYNQDSMGETFTPDAPAHDIKGNAAAARFDQLETEQFRAHWSEVQVGFVDDPRLAVERADEMVRGVVEKITQLLTNEQGALEDQWKQSTDISTEELRKVLQSYHAFFNRLMV